jgi:1,4-dihydroxy-2-naphthoate octaprenyltransferase
VLLVSVPYALIVTAVLFGKHIDKVEADTRLGVRTLPVILGEARARVVGQWLMILFYPLTLLAVLAGWIGPWVLLIVLGLPRLRSVLAVFRQPKPAGPPPRAERLWPLWFVGFAFIHTRRAGGLLTLGLLLNALLPIRLPLPWL